MEGFEHDVEELVVLIEGEIEIEFAGKRVHPEVGDEVLIPPRIRHTVANSGNAQKRWCFGYRIKTAT